MPLDRPTFERPVFIIAAPRSGSTMLFEAMARMPEIWTIGGESHGEFERVPGWHPRERGYESNRLTAVDAGPREGDALTAAFTHRLRASDGLRWSALPAEARPARVRFLEKTPKNALRIPLIKAIFPDARFVYLLREPRGNVSSIIDAWRSGRFVTYPRLPGWSGPPWSLLLPPGWRDLTGAPLEQIAAFQWRTANETAFDDLKGLPNGDWCTVTYQDIVADPAAALARLCAFIGVPWDPGLATAPLPPARHTLTAPREGKWRANEDAIEAVIPAVEPTWRRLLLAADQVRQRHTRDFVDQARPDYGLVRDID